ncbi:MAG: hypothetical protein EOO48_12185 [Flavobacterium sp.]|nr:MAG: hypothetical protein EOO48_12185 [Flavobacterium sp.]
MMMINTKTHGFFDYAMGLLLICGAYFFGLDGSGPASMVLYILGAAAIIYSLLTDYELSVAKVIPMKMHLALDIMSGIFLAASPWILGFADEVHTPHLVLGIIEIVAAIATNPKKKEATRLI